MACLQRLSRQVERQETVKRILRVFAVLSATAMVSALAVSGASASTVTPAVTGQLNATAQSGSDCNFSDGYVDCYLQNQVGGVGYGYWAAGDTHGEYVGTDTRNGTQYVFVPADPSVIGSNGETYGHIETTNGALCWNTDNPSSIYVGLESCQGEDYNEMFAMVPCPTGSWCINSYDWGPDYKLGGYPDDTPLEFENIGLGSPAYWNAFTST
jgi:hypothetical protein